MNVGLRGTVGVGRFAHLPFCPRAVLSPRCPSCPSAPAVPACPSCPGAPALLGPERDVRFEGARLDLQALLAVAGLCFFYSVLCLLPTVIAV